ncbi:hypothetical protein GKC30_13685 [Pseudodesulfovibrio sp. F-1]|uniref:Uncharacterized protein n=1 Tax=Pseudodesulfovibrio alkaliphilus TaxID=2661613 RepID=A0A7K1KRI2_9BACT|nr:hypothetical protein [Pseudodesulfovibrio alkaliphilus]MUM78687.1 hypothetical protein [Pseudodesulfovibrio alkaliphilus]
MTIRSSIASGRDARADLGRGIRSMFTVKKDECATPPVDTESERRKTPKPEILSE